VNNAAPCLASRFFVRAWLGQLYRLGTSDCRYAINIATDDLKQLYPQRTWFHISEFISFAGVMCRYFCAIGERETAVLYYQMLKQVAPRHPMTTHAKRVLYPPFWIKWLRQWAEKRLLEQADTTQRSNTTNEGHIR